MKAVECTVHKHFCLICVSWHQSCKQSCPASIWGHIALMIVCENNHILLCQLVLRSDGLTDQDSFDIESDSNQKINKRRSLMMSWGSMGSWEWSTGVGHQCSWTMDCTKFYSREVYLPLPKIEESDGYQAAQFRTTQQMMQLRSRLF